MKLDSIKINSAKIEQGDWVGNLPDLGDLRVKVRGLENADFRRLRTQLVRALPRFHREDPEANDKIMTRLLAETVLLDWENLEGETYSKERAAEILGDPDLEAFRNGVVWAATKVAEIRKQAVAADFKKLIDALIWHLDWGAAAEKIKAAATASGALPALPFLQNQPDLEEHLAFVWQAFDALSSDRHLGIGIGPIPWSAIDLYALRFGLIDPDEFEDFALLIRAMDDAYLERERKLLKQD